MAHLQRKQPNSNGVHVPVSPAPPPLQNPSELVRELEADYTVLRKMHSRISDQLHRLQVEEAVLKKQLEEMGMEMVPLEDSSQGYSELDESTMPLAALEALVFPHGEGEFKEAAAALASEVDTLEEVGLEEDDEATSSMREILQSELGGNYREAMEAEIMQQHHHHRNNRSQ